MPSRPGASEAVFSTISVNLERCTGCRTCEIACSLHNYGECNPARARIFIVRTQRDGVVTTVPVVCQQCAKPLCLDLCPSQAITRDVRTNALVVNETRCLGCRTCVLVCPFGASSVDPRIGTAQKCDLCGGDPRCVEVCPREALTFVKSDEEAIRRKRAAVGTYVQYLSESGAG